MPGHVFIVRSDLRRLAVDAWLLPCGYDAQPLQTWVDGDWSLSWPVPPPAWRARSLRTLRLDGMPAGRGTPWLTHVGGGYRVGIPWFMEGVRQFADAAAADLAGRSRHGRPRPILGFPVVGTGQGGAKRKAGEVIRAQLVEMYRAADLHDVDCVLVTWDGPTHAAAQAERRRWLTETGRSGWPDLPPDLVPVGKSLARKAKRGELVLFLGAGISASAGLPLWSGLLSQLAEAAGLTPEERTHLAALNPLDQAALVERRMGGNRAHLAAEIGRLLSVHEFSVSHALLAALPVTEVVTTNYDTLFERASEAAGKRRVAVLPYDKAAGSDRWILKLHGCIDRPDDIVLTRADYLRYGARRAALSGVVQALLITRHMLFVGFGLTDDNFHRIADAVRQALPAGSTDPLGTALMISESQLEEELWQPELSVVATGGHPLGVAARRQEILLDWVLAHAGQREQHLLDRRYEKVLSAPELELRELIDGLRTRMATLSPEAQTTDGFRRLQALLESFGSHR